MIALMLFTLCGVCIAAEPSGTGTETIVARIADEVITQEDVDKLLENLDPQMAAMYKTPEGRNVLIEELINSRLFAIKGIEEGIDKSTEYLEEIERFKKHAIMKVAIDKMLEKVTVSDEDAKKYYDENKGQFAQPEQVHARHILVSDDVEMELVLADLKAGDKFEDVAAKHSTCPSKEQGGDLGFFGKGQMVPEFEKVAFETEIGKVSDPVKTQFGVHVIKVEEKTSESTVPFEEVIEQIKPYLLNQKRNEAYQEELKLLKEKYKIERVTPTPE
jgi:peptidyl-prolyl cis-trans isomerase C